MKQSVFATIAAVAVVMVCSCQKNEPENKVGGVQLTIEATIEKAIETKTTYAEAGIFEAISVAWEETEAITVVSLGEDGITAVDEFTYSGAAGKKASFTGTWTGKAGDKVICLYPAITTNAGAALYSNVTVGSSTIDFTYPAHAPVSQIAGLKDWDAMVGTVAIYGNTASASLTRQIAVFRIGFSGGYFDSPDLHYVDQIGIYALSSTNSPVLFAKAGTIAATKSTFTGSIVPTAYQEEYCLTITPGLTKEGTFVYYYPVFADGSLNAGDKIQVKTYERERWGYGSTDRYNDYVTRTLKSSITICPGYVYSIPEIGLW